MNSVDVLIVVDALGAATSGNLQNNVYLIDTNKHVGSWNEGQAELYTNCYNTQIINWSIVAVSPNSDVAIVSFTGQMVPNVCNPSKQGIAGAHFWEGQVTAAIGQYQYSCVVSIDGTNYTFDPFLNVIQAP